MSDRIRLSIIVALLWVLPTYLWASETVISVGLEAAAQAALVQRQNMFWPSVLTVGLVTARLYLDGVPFEYVPFFNGSGFAEAVDISAFNFTCLCHIVFASNTPSLEEQTVREFRQKSLTPMQQQSRIEGLKLAGQTDRLIKTAAFWGLGFYFLTNQTANTRLIDYALSFQFFNLGLSNFRNPSPAELNLK